MSESLDAIDLSTIALNGTGRVDLSQLKTAYNNPGSQEPGHIRLYNDSGSTLKIRSDSGLIQDYIPAGAWLTYPIDHSTQAIDFTVISILPNPPIQLLMPTYFSPGEVVPDTPQLGNSPVGIGGTVNTSNIQSLSNEGGAAGLLVIDIGPAGNAQVVAIYDDHFVWSVVQSGVAHQVLKGQTSGNPLQIGATGDISELLGKLLIDQTLTVIGASSLDNGKVTTDGAGNTTVNSLVANGNVFITNGSGGTFRGQTGGFLQAFSKFAGAGSGNYNHGCGIQPTHVDPCQSVAGSQTMGYNSPNATNVNIVAGGGNAFTAMAFNI